MSVRLMHLLVIVALVAAAAYVYEIKFESMLQAERLAKLRGEIRRERDAVAALRAEWAKLDSPGRIEGLARRHLALKPLDARQIGPLDDLLERPQPSLEEVPDPIGALIVTTEDEGQPTGSVGGQDEP